MRVRDDKWRKCTRKMRTGRGHRSLASREVYCNHDAVVRGQFAIFEHVLEKACARRREIIESAKVSKRTK